MLGGGGLSLFGLMLPQHPRAVPAGDFLIRPFLHGGIKGSQRQRRICRDAQLAFNHPAFTPLVYVPLHFVNFGAGGAVEMGCHGL